MKQEVTYRTQKMKELAIQQRREKRKAARELQYLKPKIRIF